MSPSSSPKRESELPVTDDEKSSSTPISDSEIPSTLGEAEKSAETPEQYESEWTVRSSLQVLGGFMVLFNTYCSHVL
jgi:hypothetical protein